MACGGRRWQGDPSILRKRVLPDDEEVAIESEVSPIGVTVLTQASTVATHAVRFGGAASIGSHGVTKGVVMLNSRDSSAHSLSISPSLTKHLKLRSEVNQRLTLAIPQHANGDLQGEELRSMEDAEPSRFPTWCGSFEHTWVSKLGGVMVSEPGGGLPIAVGCERG
jgi:hypothetical protein